MAPISLSSTRLCRQRNSIAGVSVSAWRRPRVEWIAPSTPSCPPIAQPTWAVDVVMPRMSIRRPPPTATRRRASASARGAQAGPTARKREVAVVVAGSEGDAHLEVVVGQDREDGVAPLDEHHAAVVEHLGQPEVEGLAQLLEAVDVEVVHGQPALVDVDEGEGGARDPIRRPRARARTPGRRPSSPPRGRPPARGRRPGGRADDSAAASSRVSSTEAVVATTVTAVQPTSCRSDARPERPARRPPRRRSCRAARAHSSGEIRSSPWAPSSTTSSPARTSLSGPTSTIT